MSIVLDPNYQEIIYSIAYSSIFLEIILLKAVSLNPSDVDICLHDALEKVQARGQDEPSSIMQDMFTFQFSGPGNRHISFSITGGIFTNQLTWSDVVVIMKGLQTFFANPAYCLQSSIFMTDRQRGNLGRANLRDDTIEIVETSDEASSEASSEEDDDQ